jgi:hypothetical protein
MNFQVTFNGIYHVCIDHDSYDGPGSIVGIGFTEKEAIDEYVSQVESKQHDTEVRLQNTELNVLTKTAKPDVLPLMDLCPNDQEEIDVDIEFLESEDDIPTLTCFYTYEPFEEDGNGDQVVEVTAIYLHNRNIIDKISMKTRSEIEGLIYDEKEREYNEYEADYD